VADFYIRLGLPLIAERGLEIGEKFGRQLVSLHRTSDFRLPVAWANTRLDGLVRDPITLHMMMVE
jgi:hypothetical protein